MNLLAQVSHGPSGEEPVDIQKALPSGFFKYNCITELVFKTVDVALLLGGIGLLVFLVWGGTEWLTSGGDKGKVESAQKRITSAIIGLAIIASSYALWKIVLTFFGINAPDFCERGINTPGRTSGL